MISPGVLVFRGALAALTCSLVIALGVAPAGAAIVESGVADSSSIYPYPGSPTPQQLVDLHEGVGSEATRVTIQWNLAQPTAPPLLGSPSYDWSRFDPTINALIAAGIKPVVVLNGTPAWARDPFCDAPNCPPSELQLSKWQAFAAAVVSRYPQIRGVEAWNEPNLTAAWPGGPAPARYARLFNATARGVASIWPGKSVITGSLAYIPSTGEGGTAIRPFLEGFYDNVDWSLLNAGVGIGVHAYPGAAELGELKPDGQFNKTLAQVRAVRDEQDPNRLLYVTETGASTTGLDEDGNAVTPEQQKSAIENALAVLESANDVKMALVYRMVDREDSAPGAELGYGLVEKGAAFTPKPAYCFLAAHRGLPVPPGC